MKADPETVIKKLTKLTQQKKVKWDRVQANRDYFAGSTQNVEFYLYASHKGHKLRLYQSRDKSYYDEDKFSWELNIHLELIDNEEAVLWEFPNTQWTGDLYSAAVYQAAKIDDVLNDLVSDEW